MSKTWKIEPLSPSREKGANGSAFSLQHQESLMLSFRVVRAEPSSSAQFSVWNLGSNSRSSLTTDTELQSAIACTCLDDMAATFQVCLHAFRFK
jgi:hypothetical protein